ncbi:LacI family DNA-binding transcriptional regulator [Paenibacillus rubinfantis]|uniref:LacI family DNA-binding transcriptional regulator n=1 Tax=Paenibacillus rubinfantis TaxID=1720296 RepID=UPI00073F4165|nr:LacI family DNA-binding transcriptional regulator [Paenibacillus rubinfantis]
MGRKKKVSMQDIANRLQISKNAVSLALMDKKGVSEEMRRLVQQTAREMGYGPYAPQESGKANILVLVPERIMSYQDNDHFQFFHDMIWGLERSARKKGLNAVITPLDRETETTRSLPGPFADIPYRGVILFGIAEQDYAKRIWELDTPLVLMDSYYRDLPCPAVTSANLEGAYTAVRHLIEAGHRRIGFIGPTNLSTSHEERWFGYEKAIKEQGLFIREADCLTISKGYDYTAAEMADFLDGLREWPTAFFCGNDRIAYLLAGLLKERSKRMPEDVSIAGFDDLPYVNSEGLSMTTMRVEKERMCDAAIQLLLSELGRTREAIHWQVEPTLVVRDSVARKL